MLSVAEIFGSNMVLQRNKPISIWGSDTEGELITVALCGKETSAPVIGGEWKVTLPPLAAVESTQMVIRGSSTICFENVAIGEVWLAGGQSNMEFWMEFDRDYEKEKTVCRDASLRFFDYPEVTYEGQTKDFDYSEMGIWRVCDPENLKFYSAVAYYAAKKIRAALHVPVGIVGCNWGGTPIATWMDETYVQKHGASLITDYENIQVNIPENEKNLELFRKNPANGHGKPFEDFFNVTLLRGISREQQLQMVEEGMNADSYFLVGPFHQNRPSQLYHSMIEKVAPYTIRGFFWYQGESDSDHPYLYKSMFRDFVENMRELWGDPLPFITVQLAPFGDMWQFMTGENYPIIRQAQEENAEEMDSVYMVSSSDCGMLYDIHPKNKQPIGERIGRVALNKIYGLDLLSEMPKAREMILEKDRIILTFDNAGEGLYLMGDTLNALEITIDGRTVKPESTTVKKDRVVLELASGKKNTVRFAKTAFYEVNLYNSADIPAIPFEFEEEN